MQNAFLQWRDLVLIERKVAEKRNVVSYYKQQIEL